MGCDPHPTAPTGSDTLSGAASPLLRLLRLARPYWGRLAGGAAIGLLVTALGVATPYVTKLLIDDVYPRRDVGLLHLLVAAMLGLGIASSLLAAGRATYTAGVRWRLGGEVRLRFFNHLQHLPMRFFDRHRVGEVAARLQEASRGVDVVGRTFELVLTQGLFLLVVPPVLVHLEPRLALLALSAVPLVAAVNGLASRRLRHLWQESSAAAAELSAQQVEVLSRIRTFKSFGLERRVHDEARRQVDAVVGAQLRAQAGAQRLGGLNGALRAASTAALAWLGWSLILGGRMTLGDFVAFSAYVGFLYNPVFLLFQVFSELQQAAVDLGRMFEYLDLAAEGEPARVDGPWPQPVAGCSAGSYRLRGVSFSYEPGRPVLHGVDLELAPGEVVALVGSSGSGKTTLLRLLAGLERPLAGEMWVDGERAERLPVERLRARAATVWQDGGLVRGSLWRNITLALEEEPPRADVDRVVARCGLSELVARLPDGYDTEVAEGGASLSAGQQQRVAIARALLRDAPALLLDEATANLDLDTERRILDDLLAAASGRTTVLFVTHRPATAELADRVLTLEDGRLAERRPTPRLAAGGTAAVPRLAGGGGAA